MYRLRLRPRRSRERWPSSSVPSPAPHWRTSWRRETRSQRSAKLSANKPFGKTTHQLCTSQNQMSIYDLFEYVIYCWWWCSFSFIKSCQGREESQDDGEEASGAGRCCCCQESSVQAASAKGHQGAQGWPQGRRQLEINIGYKIHNAII